MDRKDQLYVLKWMLDFVSKDIDKLQPQGKMLLLRELDAALSGFLGHKYMRLAWSFVTWPGRSKESPETFIPEKIRQAERLQRYMKTFLQDIFEKIKKARESEGDWLGIPEFNELFYLAQVTIKETAVNAVIEAETWDWPDEEGFEDRPAMACWPAGELKKGIIKIARRVPNDEDALIFHFLEAVDGLPLKYIQECAECGRWFVASDERDRTYCSPECGRKKRNRDYYDGKKRADPVAHERKLADKREEAHERYKARVKQTQPDADVKRRPRKKTRKED